MKQSLLKLPKNRGFRSLQAKKQVVNISQINKYFKDNETVSLQTLFEKKLVNKKDIAVKILGKDIIIPKGLKFENVSFSESVKKQIENK